MRSLEDLQYLKDFTWGQVLPIDKDSHYVIGIVNKNASYTPLYHLHSI